MIWEHVADFTLIKPSWSYIYIMFTWRCLVKKYYIRFLFTSVFPHPFQCTLLKVCECVGCCKCWCRVFRQLLGSDCNALSRCISCCVWLVQRAFQNSFMSALRMILKFVMCHLASLIWYQFKKFLNILSISETHSLTGLNDAVLECFCVCVCVNV